MKTTVLTTGFLIVAVSLAAAKEPVSRVTFEAYPAAPGGDSPVVRAWVEDSPLLLGSREIFHADSDGRNRMEIAFARFAAEGPVRIRLESTRSEFGRATLRAVGRDVALLSGGAKSLSFELPGPGQYYLQAPGLAVSNHTFTVVFWVDSRKQLEQLKSRSRAPGTVNLAEIGIRPDAELDQTGALQAALDKSGSIFVPPGTYRSGSLKIRSNTTLLFAPGAVIRAVAAEKAVGSEFISIEGAQNVKLCGPGTIDAFSFACGRKHNAHNLNVTSSRDVSCEDILFEGSNSWAVHVRKSDRFTARNVRVLSGKDGFDPDASRDVLIERAFVVSGDDAIAVKNRFPDEPDGKVTERVTFRDSIVSTFKSALKIGTESRGPIRDVLFENCEVFDSDRGIVLYAKDGGPVERATWRNIRVGLRNWPQEKESGTVFHVVIDRREGATPVRDCMIEKVMANWIYRSELAGLPDAPLNGVSFRDIQAFVESPKTGRPALFVCRDNVEVPVRGLRVDWQGNAGRWNGIVSGKGMNFSGTTESDKAFPPRSPNRAAEAAGSKSDG